MSRKNANSARRVKCSHCKVALSSTKPHRKNCTVKNNEAGWPRETEMTRRYTRNG